jgi:ribonucleotide reductase beta subunit family protein with ferritin-like domain
MEPILNSNNSRFTIYPIEYNNIWKLYQQQMACMWKAQEVDFSKDYEDFNTLDKDVQHFIKMILSFFASSDGIINLNLSERFMKDIQIIEAKVAYTFQMTMEWVHAESYSLMLDNIIRDPIEKKKLFDSISTVESVKMISEWAMEWIDSDLSFHHRIIAFAVVEGIMFSGAFAAIFWLKKYMSNGRLFMQGLIKSNEFIARDEGLHTLFACEIYSLLQNKLSYEDVLKIVTKGADIAKIFMRDALPVKLIGMNNESMSEYIEYVSDRLLVSLGYPKYYNTKNPFVFMETIGMLQKTNFFESRPTEYQSAHVFNDDDKNKEWNISDEF